MSESRIDGEGAAFSPEDARWMRAALALARRHVGRTSPNPPVGAVLVRDGAVVGRGAHRAAGLPHAEIEALAQLAGVLMLRRIEYSGKLTFLVGMDEAKWRRAVVPGDQLRLEAEIERATARRARVAVKAMVDGKIVTSARLKFMLADSEPA